MTSKIKEQLAMNEIRPIIRLEQNDETNHRFDFPFPITEASDIRVAIDHQLFNQDEYKVYGFHQADGGYIECNQAPPVSSEIVIWRKLAGKRQELFLENGEIRAVSLNAALDRLTMLQQDFNLFLETKIGLSVSQSNDQELSLPTPEPRRTIMWDETGSQLVNSTHDPDVFFTRASELLTEGQNAIATANDAAFTATNALNEAKDLAFRAENLSLKGKPSFYGFRLNNGHLSIDYGADHYQADDYQLSMINVGGIVFSLSNNGHLLANLTGQDDLTTIS